MAHPHLTQLFAVGLVAVACGPAAPPPEGPHGGGSPSPPPAAANSPAPAELPDSGWQLVRGRHVSLEVPLPVASQWQIVDGEHELRAIHRPTNSELTARIWRAVRLVSRDECAKRLHLWRPELPDPEKSPESVLETHELFAPEGFSVSLTVGVRRTASALEGYLIAIGVSVGQCYAATYVTRASGSGAEAAIGERLAVVGDRVLSRVQRVGVEARVP